MIRFVETQVTNSINNVSLTPLLTGVVYMGVSKEHVLQQAIVTGMSFAADDSNMDERKLLATVGTRDDAHANFLILKSRTVGTDVTSKSLNEMGDDHAQPLIMGVLKTPSGAPRVIGMQRFRGEDGQDIDIIRTCAPNMSSSIDRTSRVQTIRKTVEVDAPCLYVSEHEKAGVHAKYQLQLLECGFLQQPKIEFDEFLGESRRKRRTPRQLPSSDPATWWLFKTTSSSGAITYRRPLADEAVELRAMQVVAKPTPSKSVTSKKRNSTTAPPSDHVATPTSKPPRAKGKSTTQGTPVSVANENGKRDRSKKSKLIEEPASRAHTRRSANSAQVEAENIRDEDGDTFDPADDDSSGDDRKEVNLAPFLRKVQSYVRDTTADGVRKLRDTVKHKQEAVETVDPKKKPKKKVSDATSEEEKKVTDLTASVVHHSLLFLLG